MAESDQTQGRKKYYRLKLKSGKVIRFPGPEKYASSVRSQLSATDSAVGKLKILKEVEAVKEALQDPDNIRVERIPKIAEYVDEDFGNPSSSG